MKKALVIGGSNGIGLAIVKHLITGGYFVSMLDCAEPERDVLLSGTYDY